MSKEKHTAIKLLNKYADSYHLLENKILQLKRENSDLRANLLINKQIIQGFFKGSSRRTKQNENIIIPTQPQIVQTEVDNDTDSYNKTLDTLKDELRQLQSKVFLLENLIKEKENENNHLKQLSKKTASPGEIYITSPAKVVNKLNDELELLRSINSKLTSHIKTYKDALLKKEKVVKTLNAQLEKAKNELDLMKLDKTNSTIMTQLNQYKIANNRAFLGSSGKLLMNKSANLLFNDNNLLDISGLSGSSTPNLDKTAKTLMTQIEKLEQVNISKKKINKKDFDLTEEWNETLKHCNITQNQYIAFCNRKELSQLTDVIEYLYKLIIDKNIQIKLISEENDCLNLDNLKLNKTLLELNEKVKVLESNNNVSRNTKGNTNDNSTFVNMDGSINNINDSRHMMDYLKEVKQSITSSEFQEGMILDQFDLVSEMSKKYSNGAK